MNLTWSGYKMTLYEIAKHENKSLTAVYNEHKTKSQRKNSIKDLAIEVILANPEKQDFKELAKLANISPISMKKYMTEEGFLPIKNKTKWDENRDKLFEIIRQNAHLTQAEIAKIAGCHRYTIIKHMKMMSDMEATQKAKHS